MSAGALAFRKRIEEKAAKRFDVRSGLGIMKRIAIIIGLFFVASSGFFASVESALDFDTGPQAAISTDDQESSADPTRARRHFKRSSRVKSSPKSLPTVKRPHPRSWARTTQRPALREISPMGWMNEAGFTPRVSKSSVFQQTNVYRI
jgi:hypothetical protein